MMLSRRISNEDDRLVSGLNALRDIAAICSRTIPFAILPLTIPWAMTGVLFRVVAPLKSQYFQVLQNVTLGHSALTAGERCSGLTRPDIVLFGEALPDKFQEKSREELRTASVAGSCGSPGDAIILIAHVASLASQDSPEYILTAVRLAGLQPTCKTPPYLHTKKAIFSRCYPGTLFLRFSMQTLVQSWLKLSDSGRPPLVLGVCLRTLNIAELFWQARPPLHAPTTMTAASHVPLALQG